MSILQELRRRKVFRVAAAYVVVAWGILQFIDVISDPLSLPPWFDTVAVVLLGIGFPVALVLGWAFDIGEDGLTRTTGDAAPASTGRGKSEVVLLVLLIIGIGWLIFRDIDSGPREPRAPSHAPVVILMDTFAPRGVYDEETRKNSGTNADVLSDVLRELPIITQKEAIGSVWDRETQILKQNPGLILIHRSAFFHSMNEELGFGYPQSAEEVSEEWLHLYQIADNKLIAFMGHIALGNPTTRFIVYSRGTGGGWADTEFRANWIKQAVGRFPALADRINGIKVPGGLAAGSFRTRETGELMRALVRELLQLGESPMAHASD